MGFDDQFALRQILGRGCRNGSFSTLPRVWDGSDSLEADVLACPKRCPGLAILLSHVRLWPWLPLIAGWRPRFRLRDMPCPAGSSAHQTHAGAPLTQVL